MVCKTILPAEFFRPNELQWKVSRLYKTKQEPRPSFHNAIYRLLNGIQFCLIFSIKTCHQALCLKKSNCCAPINFPLKTSSILLQSSWNMTWILKLKLKIILEVKYQIAVCDLFFSAYCTSFIENPRKILFQLDLLTWENS